MPRRTPILAAAFLAAALLAPASAAELSEDLRSALDAGRTSANVIVRMHPGEAHGRLLSALIADPGARALPGLDMLAVSVSATEIESLARDTAVAAISLDRDVRALARRTGMRQMKGAKLARTPRVAGSGVGIALIDTGVDKAATPRPVRAVSFVRRDDAADRHGHGTFLAGVIRETAPRADLVSLRVLDAEGRGRTSGVLAAIDWLLANGERHGVRIATLALSSDGGGRCVTDPLCQGTRALRSAGILPVTAAGSSRRGGLASPGRSPYVVTVGAAVDRGTARRGDDAVADDSPRGAPRRVARPKPDLVAHHDRQGYRGTSIAAAAVSAAAALLVDAAPSLDPDELTAILLYTCQTLDGADAFAQGAGLLNTDGALTLARALGKAHGAGRSGVAHAAMPAPYSEIGDALVPWSAGHVVIPGAVFTTRYRPSRGELEGEMGRDFATVLAGGAVEVGHVRIAGAIELRDASESAMHVRYTTAEGHPIRIVRTPTNGSDATPNAAALPGRGASRTNPDLSVADHVPTDPYSSDVDKSASRARSGPR